MKRGKRVKEARSQSTFPSSKDRWFVGFAGSGRRSYREILKNETGERRGAD